MEPHRFRTTNWSLIVAAGGESSAGRNALERLCSTYWHPIYAFIRRSGYDDHRAADLTQGFFAMFLERRDYERVDSERGSFRGYLLSSVRHFMANERVRARALKRGGGDAVLGRPSSGDDVAPIDPADHFTPERAFERAWAVAILATALERVRSEYSGRDREALFESLKPTLAGEPVIGGYAGVAARLDSTPSAVKAAAHRLRDRYRALILVEVAGTVCRPQDTEAELRHLFDALAH